MKLDENIKKHIVCIRQEIRESMEMKEKSKEKTVIGKQYPSLDKSEQDV
jgi:fructose-1-phosphate kinase PfkB-like protein